MFTPIKSCKSRTCIRIAAWAQIHEKFAAEELARYFKQISGATVPVTAGLKNLRGNEIILADLSNPATAGLIPDSLGNGLKYDGYRIGMYKGNLFIVSRMAGGLVFGVYEYLRRFVGCHFLDYGKKGETISRRRIVTHVNPDVLDNPRIWYRGLQFIPGEPKDIMLPRIDWMAKNGFTHVLVHLQKGDWNECRAWLIPELAKRGLRLALGHHNFSYLLPKEMFYKDLPEFYAKIKGRRKVTPQLQWCLANERLIETVSQRVIQLIRDNPETEIVELWPDDGIAPVCECAACKALDQPGDMTVTAQDDRYGRHPHARRGDLGKMRRYLHLANRVAERLAKFYPQVRLNIISYSDLSEPPVDAKLAPNIMVTLAIYWRCARHFLFDPGCHVNNQFQACIKRWLEVVPSESLIFYEYYMGMDAWASLPYPILTNLFSEWDSQVKLGIGGAHVQSRTTHMGVYGINYLAFARLAREKPPSFKKFLQEYCHDYFGPAEKHLLAVYDAWEQGMQQGNCRMQSALHEVKGLFSAALINICRRHLGKAQKIVRTGIYRWRVERVLAQIEYIELWRRCPGGILELRLGKATNPRSYARRRIWLEKLEDFIAQHMNLNDDLFPVNHADLLKRRWFERV